MQKLEEFVAAMVPRRPATDYEWLEHAISIDMFGPKAKLMWEFRSKIGILEDAIKQA